MLRVDVALYRLAVVGKASDRQTKGSLHHSQGLQAKYFGGIVRFEKGVFQRKVDNSRGVILPPHGCDEDSLVPDRRRTSWYLPTEQTIKASSLSR